MNLRKGLIAAATALTVSVAGVGVASAAPETSSVQILAADEVDGGDKKGSSLSSTDNDKTDDKDDVELSSTDGLEQISGVIGVLSAVIGLVVTVFSALNTLDFI